MAGEADYSAGVAEVAAWPVRLSSSMAGVAEYQHGRRGGVPAWPATLISSMADEAEWQHGQRGRLAGYFVFSSPYGTRTRYCSPFSVPIVPPK